MAYHENDSKDQYILLDEASASAFWADDFWGDVYLCLSRDSWRLRKTYIILVPANNRQDAKSRPESRLARNTQYHNRGDLFGKVAQSGTFAETNRSEKLELEYSCIGSIVWIYALCWPQKSTHVRLIFRPFGVQINIQKWHDSLPLVQTKDCSYTQVDDEVAADLIGTLDVCHR